MPIEPENPVIRNVIAELYRLKGESDNILVKKKNISKEIKRLIWHTDKLLGRQSDALIGNRWAMALAEIIGGEFNSGQGGSATYGKGTALCTISDGRDPSKKFVVGCYYGGFNPVNSSVYRPHVPDGPDSSAGQCIELLISPAPGSRTDIAACTGNARKWKETLEAAGIASRNSDDRIMQPRDYIIKVDITPDLPYCLEEALVKKRVNELKGHIDNPKHLLETIRAKVREDLWGNLAKAKGPNGLNP